MEINRPKLRIDKDGRIVRSGYIQPNSVDDLEATMEKVDTITSKFNILQQQIDRNKKSDRRRTWTNPRKYRSAGNSKRKA